jgi:hypothetical protein
LTFPHLKIRRGEKCRGYFDFDEAFGGRIDRIEKHCHPKFQKQILKNSYFTRALSALKDISVTMLKTRIFMAQKWPKFH